MSGDRGRAADDQRSPGLVDENGVHFINDGKVMGALDLLVAAGGHAVVAQVVESELAVRAVGNVAEVLGAAQLRRLVVLNRADGKAQKGVELSHPLGVAASQIVVDRHDMNSASRERVQIHRQSRHESLAFAGGHLRDSPAMEHQSADELDVEMHHPPDHRLIADGKCLLTFSETARAML